MAKILHNGKALVMDELSLGGLWLYFIYMMQAFSWELD